MRYLTWAALLGAGIAAAQDWPRFRGPNGSGVSDSTGLPAEFGPGKNMVWKTAIPFSRSSPVVAGERIFVTAAEGEKLVTLCLDRATGRVRWRREIVRPRAMPLYKMNDGASPSPATDGRNVYAFFPDLGLVSYGPEGEERWRVPLGPFDSFYGMSASPVVAGKTLLMVCDARAQPFVLALDAATGRTRWRVERTDTRMEGFASPIVWEPPGQGAQVIVLGAHRIDAYELATGERTWWLRGLGNFPVASPILGKGVVVFSTYGSDGPQGPLFEEMLKSDRDGDGKVSREEARDFEEFGGVDRNNDGFLDRAEWDTLRHSGIGEYGMIALRLGERGERGKKAFLWRDSKNYTFVPSALIYKDVLYMVKSGGIITSLDPLTGRVFKTDRSKEALGEYYSSPVAADDKIFLVSEPGKVTVLRAGRQWEILAVNDLGDECHATPAIAAGRIYVRTRSALYSFGVR